MKENLSTQKISSRNDSQPTKSKNGMAAFHSLVHRAVNIPMDKEDFNTEIKITKQIAKNNGYNIEIVGFGST